jgi:hypothetical protein
MQPFDKILLETIDEIIQNVFDEEISRIIFNYLRKENSTENRIKIFSDVLPKLVGVGYTIVEDLILETLYSKFGSTLEHNTGNTFLDYIQDLERKQTKGVRNL